MNIGTKRVVDPLRSASAGLRDPGSSALTGREGDPAAPGRYTWAELDEAVTEQAHQLAAKGALAGRVYPVRVEADLDGVLTLLGLWRLGATPAPLNPRLTDHEEARAHAALGGLVGEGAQVVLWTSGTSGRPRGVALSFDAMRAHVEAVRERLDLDPGRDTWLASLSPAHVGGLMLIFRAVYTGSRLVALGPASSGQMAEVLRNGEPRLAGGGPVTHASLVPTQLLRILDASQDAPPSPALRCVLLGGAHAPPALLSRARDSGWPVALTYGMTEMCSQVATAPPDRESVQPGCVGSALAGVEIRIDVTEEILVRGPTMASGYLDGSPLADAEGWYHTGDLGRLDGTGQLWITGRRIDRIVSGGVNVDPAEVEEALRAHPSVADACVTGVPDDEWGEVVAAWVVPVAGEFDVDEVDAWLRERLAGPKRPRRWVVESQIPLNANGKVDRARVRDALGGPR